MSCHRICAQQRQPCPSAWLCSEGCNFNNEVVPMQSAQERAAAQFWDIELIDNRPSAASNPGYPFELLDEGPRWKRIALAVAAVLACMLVAAVVVPK